MPTLFERIIQGEIPSEKVYEDDLVIAIHDIAPKAPVHILIITKKAIPSLQDLAPEDLPLLRAVFQTAQTLAHRYGIDTSGYRLVVNCGADAGQTIFHLHFHLLGGKMLEEMG